MDRVAIVPSERHAVDDVADLYSVLVALEKLEKANTRDLVSPESYQTALQRLLTKYALIVEQLKEIAQQGSAASGTSTASLSGTSGLSAKVGIAEMTGKLFLEPDGKGLDRFIAEYSLPVPAARARISNPTRAQGAGGNQRESLPQGPRVDPKLVLEVGQHFITLMDCVKLQQTAVDQLHPILSDLLSSLRQAAPNFEPTEKLNSWMTKLNSMHASDSLDERDTRELAFDLDRSYQQFHRFLQNLNNPTPTQSAPSSAVSTTSMGA